MYGWITTRIDVKIGGTVLVAAGGLSPVIPLVLVGIVVLALFVLWQRYKNRAGKEPLIELSIFKNRAAAVGLPTILVLAFLQSGLLFVAPVFLQMSLGLSPLLCGLTIMPLTIFLIAFSQLSSKLARKYSAKTLVMVGMALVPVGTLLVWLLLEDKPSALQMIPGFIVVGIGIGLANAPLLNMVQSTATVEKQSEISGLNRAFSNLGGSLGTAVAGAVLMSILISTSWGLVGASPVITQNVTPQQLQSFKLDLDRDAKTMSDVQAKAFFAKMAAEEQQKGLQTQVAQKLETEMVTINQQARNKALLSALLAVGILGLLGFVLTIFLPHVKPTKEEEPAGTVAAAK
jgi:MFS family permease